MHMKANKIEKIGPTEMLTFSRHLPKSSGMLKN